MDTEKEHKIIQKALLYDLRLIFSTGEKDTYTRDEIVELLDKIALAKDQEQPKGPAGCTRRAFLFFSSGTKGFASGGDWHSAQKSAQTF